jgi:hypothetical protein
VSRNVGIGSSFLNSLMTSGSRPDVSYRRMLGYTAMLYLPISRASLFSRAAQGIYFASTMLAIALIATRIGIMVALAMAGRRALNPAAAALARLLLYPEIAGLAVLWVAMWYFWFGFDRSHYLKRALWFVLLFFLVPIANPLLLCGLSSAGCCLTRADDSHCGASLGYSREP